MSKTERVLLKAVKLALSEFKRIAYQKKADPSVIQMLEKAVEFAENRSADKLEES